MSDRVEGYADAFLQVARAEGDATAVANELFHFARALERSDELRQTITDESLPPEKRQAIVEDLIGDKASPVTSGLVSFVVGVNRGRDLIAIIDRTVEKAAAQENREVAQVYSSVALDDDQQERLAEALSEALDKQVQVKVVVDPEVLGGLLVRVGDTVIDGSVRSRLDRIRETL